MRRPLKLEKGCFLDHGKKYGWKEGGARFGRISKVSKLVIYAICLLIYSFARETIIESLPYTSHYYKYGVCVEEGIVSDLMRFTLLIGG